MTQNVPTLTPRQLDVLRCLARGLQDKEIAVELGISPTTVRKHVGDLCSAFKVERRLGVVLAALGWPALPAAWGSAS